MEATNPTELSRRWLLAAGCFALLLFFFSPAWAAFSYWAKVPELGGMIEVRRGASVLQQVEHPGAPLADALHGAIQWRLLFPLLGRALHLPAWALFGLADVGCLLVLGVIVTVLRRHGLSFARCALVTVILGATSWCFTSTGWLGYYDSWVVLALLLTAFGESRWTVWAACLWAPWVDERFVLAAPLALLCRQIDRTRRGLGFDWQRELAVPAALLAAFVVVRLGVLGGRSGANATPGSYLAALDATQAPLSRLLFGAWAGLRAAWLFVALAVVLLAARQRAQALLLGAGAIVLAIVGLVTAQDFSRSMMFLMPVAVLGAVLAAQAWPRWLTHGLPVATAAALLLPAHHVMSNDVMPIFYVYHALDTYHNPPRALMPEVVELEAIRAMQAGDFATAEQGFGMAMRLAPNPAEPARQRGVLRGAQGKWREAREDFAFAAQHEPKNPDAWFLCAQADTALGNLAGAQENLEHALSVAPAGWSSRPDVTRLQTRLNPRR